MQRVRFKRALAGAAVAALLLVCRADADTARSGQPLGDPRAGRRLVFQDDFDSLSLRRNGVGVWTPRFHMAGPNELGSRTLPTNGEQQIYVDPDFAGTAKARLGLNPFRTRDGRLVIEAKKASPAVSAAIWNYRYTSGLLTTKDSFSQTYGYFEIRARLPKGAGLWPAFWLLPASGEWPPEIDVLEVLGQDPTTVHQTLHWGSSDRHLMEHAQTVIADTSQDFHTYGVEWTEKTIRWFIDERETARAPTPADLHQPMYLLVNLAVGGHWPGKVAPKAVPAQLEIDYIRVYGPGRASP